MKHLHFEPETDGFYGAYRECKTPSDTAMIAMLGDDPEDLTLCQCPPVRRITAIITIPSSV